MALLPDPPSYYHSEMQRIQEMSRAVARIDARNRLNVKEMASIREDGLAAARTPVPSEISCVDDSPGDSWINCDDGDIYASTAMLPGRYYGDMPSIEASNREMRRVPPPTPSSDRPVPQPRRTGSCVCNIL